MKLSNKVVAITGGARGIGLATATTLQGMGASVAIGDIDVPAVDEAGAGLGSKVCRRLDVTDRQSFTEFLDSVEADLGPLDVLVNNAGVIAVGNAVDESDAITQQLLDGNVFGVMLGTKLAAERMLARGRGHIVNIASLGSVTPVAGTATYCATKHAVLGYTDSVRMENRGSGVQFSAILPTLTNTEMIAGVGRAKGVKNAEPEDVAKAVAGVIVKPEPRVFVPRSLSFMVGTQRLLPHRVAEALGRSLGRQARQLRPTDRNVLAAQAGLPVADTQVDFGRHRSRLCDVGLPKGPNLRTAAGDLTRGLTQWGTDCRCCTAGCRRAFRWWPRR